MKFEKQFYFSYFLAITIFHFAIYNSRYCLTIFCNFCCFCSIRRSWTLCSNAQWWWWCCWLYWTLWCTRWWPWQWIPTIFNFKLYTKHYFLQQIEDVIHDFEVLVVFRVHQLAYHSDWTAVHWNVKRFSCKIRWLETFALFSIW